MVPTMNIDRPCVGMVRDRDARPDVLPQRLKYSLAGFCLGLIGLLPFGAAAQITEPLLPLLPTPAPPSAPQAPVSQAPTTYPGQTVSRSVSITSRIRANQFLFAGTSCRFQ